MWSFPPFDTAAEHLRVVKDISLAGDGEPTISPQFLEVVDAVIALVSEVELEGIKRNY